MDGSSGDILHFSPLPNPLAGEGKMLNRRGLRGDGFIDFVDDGFQFAFKNLI
jgi:hypothetical protein